MGTAFRFGFFFTKQAVYFAVAFALLASTLEGVHLLGVLLLAVAAVKVTFTVLLTLGLGLVWFSYRKSSSSGGKQF